MLRDYQQRCQGGRMIRFGSVCSGIEAASVAWHPLGWRAAWLSEIEPFPSAVLAHHYPDVPNLGDMTKFKEWNLDQNTVDILVGGTPCQSFSVAGLRKGLDDPRGNLALVYCSMLDHFRPKWFVWENVPGVLSSSGGRDFGSFLGAVAELGYGFAYRVLDAQYFGVAQRRRRVFVVGHLGSWQPAAAVLFERESLCRNTAPSREKREEVAKCLTTGIGQRYDPETESLIPAYGIPGNWIGRKPDNGGNAVPPMYDIAPNLTSTDRHGVAHPIPFDTTQITSKHNYSKPKEGDPCHPLAAGAHPPAIANTMAVRRLTPVECERLQGFPDGFTNIPWRKSEESPDGPRYKALGNSMAVPVMRWIGERIKMVDEIC